MSLKLLIMDLVTVKVVKVFIPFGRSNAHRKCTQRASADCALPARAFLSIWCLRTSFRRCGTVVRCTIVFLEGCAGRGLFKNIIESAVISIFQEKLFLLLNLIKKYTIFFFFSFVELLMAVL